FTARQAMILYDAEVAVVLAVFPPVSAAQEHRKQQNARVWPRKKEGRSSLSGFPNSRVAGKRLGLAVWQKTAGAAKTRLTLEDPHRFKRSRDVGCYLGLRPRSSQSGETNPEMRISKEGDTYLRKLLVQCAQVIL